MEESKFWKIVGNTLAICFVVGLGYVMYHSQGPSMFYGTWFVKDKSLTEDQTPFGKRFVFFPANRKPAPDVHIDFYDGGEKKGGMKLGQVTVRMKGGYISSGAFYNCGIGCTLLAMGRSHNYYKYYVRIDDNGELIIKDTTFKKPIRFRGVRSRS